MSLRRFFRHPIIWAILIYGLWALAAHAGGDYYKVTVTRKAQDVYQDSTTRTVIITRWCYEYVYYEEAILEWSGADGRLIFISGGSVCDVERVIR